MIELDAPDWWTQLPVLSGPSIRIREVEAADAAALLELFSDPRVNQYLYPPPSSLTRFEGFIEWAQRQREAAKCVCFVVVPNGLQQPIGLFQLRALDREFQVAEWGFAMAPSFWSTGLFEEAAGLVAEFAFAIGVEAHRGARRRRERPREPRARKNRREGRSAAAKSIQAQRAAVHVGHRRRRVVSGPSAPDPTPFEAARIRAQIARAIAEMPSRRAPSITRGRRLPSRSS